MLKVENLCVTLQGKNILKNLNFDVEDGKILAILGPSGGGKTTLLRCLARLETHFEGSIVFDGKPLQSLPSGKVGMVFQAFHLFPHLRTIDNLMLAPKCQKNEDDQIILKKAEDLLDQFGLKNLAQAYPHQLSGGQKQRVAIARTLMMEPSLLLFDEPTSALDKELVSDVAKMVLSTRKPNRVIIVVTHEVHFARHIADHILFLENGNILDNNNKDDFFNLRNTSSRAQDFLNNSL